MKPEVLIDLLTLIVTCATFSAAMGYFVFEEYHRRKDATPQCRIIERYHDDNVAVVIANHGTGILIIDSVQVKKNGEIRNNLISFMPKVNQYWKGYSLETAGRELTPLDEVVLCAIHPACHRNRDKVLKALSDIEITVIYHNGHSKKKHTVTKKLVYPLYFLKNRKYKIKGD